ncbi:serine/threonine-protein kinase Nek11-like isoform X2 [Hyla sarda]|uniref:serine/threonine-protein kinase Nek11-like isoform X2 n=1 Tax=Hyla sarda TaxID=327740 RepID=UPI0024C3DCF4|nr:serine/threonine-protein kinase Nek11-like isoform X2 [Hyla sarda]
MYRITVPWRQKVIRKVIKRIPCNTLRGDATLPSAREAKLLGNLRHPFIVQFFGSFLEKTDFCIVTEYCEGGDLHCYLQQQKDKGENLTEGHVMEWLIQLLLGVNYLHERLVMHRDLKTRNIFLKNGTLKIGDFGVSRILAQSDMATTITGTASYMSPEVYSNTGYNTKSDIWSLGCILYEMCSFNRAFDCPRWIKLISMIVNGPSPTLPSKYSAALNDILQRMLMKDPELRPSAIQILQFPYVNQRGQVLSEWLQEVVYQDRKDSVDEDVSRITAAMQEKLHLDSLHAMREVQEMAPRQRRRIRQVEEPETHMKKLKRAVERVCEENRQRMEQNMRYKANDDVHWVEEKPVEQKDIHSEDEESIDGSVLLISLPLSEQQSSTISAYQNCLQRFLDSNSNTAETQNSAPWDSENTTISICSKQEIVLLRQECVQLLGEEAFLEVYNYWKVYNQQVPASEEIEENTLCEPQVMKLHPQHCYKVEQLLFLEERIEVESPEPSFTWL